jgi:hypothetical protein
MDNSSTILGQLLSLLPKRSFNRFVGQHNADRYTKKLTSWNQLATLVYAQATGKDSLREIETGISTHESSLYHLGINSAKRSSLSYANNNRNYQIFEKLFHALLKQCQEVASVDRQFKFGSMLYILDSTTISLCLNLFDWAKYSKTKGAIKLHMILDSTAMLPKFINITDGKPSDITAAKQIDLGMLEKGSIIVFDRGYIDYKWWDELDNRGVTFVSRTKKSQHIYVIGQHKNGLGKGILADDKVMFGSYGAIEKYTKDLRKIRYWDEENQKEYEYLTNNFDLSAKQIADIYKDRWQIELFFKWIKQNLKIKTFLGTSKNAVMTQIWVAMIYYLLLAYIKLQTKFSRSLLELTRMVREVLMFKRSLVDLLSLNARTIYKLQSQEIDPQLSFW